MIWEVESQRNMLQILQENSACILWRDDMCVRVCTRVHVSTHTHTHNTRVQAHAHRHTHVHISGERTQEFLEL